ncbi:MAG: hypothetical protein ONB41_14250 [candidate division KSB1 bacterium]|nr:hypothetical protein [candidate division KSB1 bacterium]
MSLSLMTERWRIRSRGFGVFAAALGLLSVCAMAFYCTIRLLVLVKE